MEQSWLLDLIEWQILINFDSLKMQNNGIGSLDPKTVLVQVESKSVWGKYALYPPTMI